MTTAITDKNWVLVARGNIKLYVNEAEFNGIKKIRIEWARYLGITQNAITDRLRRYSFPEMINKFYGGVLPE
mgnify:CR=1 FL=1